MLNESRWNNLVDILGAKPEACDDFSRLEVAYAEPHRHYHDAGRPRIFQTTQFFDRYEARARSNLAAAIRGL